MMISHSCLSIHGILAFMHSCIYAFMHTYSRAHKKKCNAHNRTHTKYTNTMFLRRTMNQRRTKRIEGRPEVFEYLISNGCYPCPRRNECNSQKILDPRALSLIPLFPLALAFLTSKHPSGFFSPTHTPHSRYSCPLPPFCP